MATKSTPSPSSPGPRARLPREPGLEEANLVLAERMRRGDLPVPVRRADDARREKIRRLLAEARARDAADATTEVLCRTRPGSLFSVFTQ